MKKVVLAALFAVSSPVFAQGYVGIGIGQSNVDIESTPYTISKEDSDTAFKVFGGAELNKNFAIEAGYVNFGEFGMTEAGTFIENTPSGTLIYDESLKQSVEGFAFYTAVVGKLPVTNAFELFAKAGFALWDIDLRGQYNADVYSYSTGAYLWSESYSVSINESGVDPMFGVGVQFDAGNLLLRAEFERFNEIEVDVIGLSAAVKF